MRTIFRILMDIMDRMSTGGWMVATAVILFLGGAVAMVTDDTGDQAFAGFLLLCGFLSAIAGMQRSREDGNDRGLLTGQGNPRPATSLTLHLKHQLIFTQTNRDKDGPRWVALVRAKGTRPGDQLTYVYHDWPDLEHPPQNGFMTVYGPEETGGSGRVVHSSV